MVSFQSNPEQYSSNKTLQKLDAHIKAASSLGNRVDDLQKKISLSPMYLRKVCNSLDPKRKLQQCQRFLLLSFLFS